MHRELVFPPADKVKLVAPKVARIGLKLEIGDDVRIVTKALVKFRDGSDRKIGLPCWATVVDHASPSKHTVIVSSFEPCERPLKRGFSLLVCDDDIWHHHAPGSHMRFIRHVSLRNAEARADSRHPVKELCWSPIQPCYQHEYELSHDFDDVRGCWRCGIELPEGEKVTLPVAEGARLEIPKGKKGEVSFTCGHCMRACYCSPACADLDVFAHKLPCAYWKKE